MRTIGLGTIIKKLVYLYAVIHLALSVIGFLGMLVFFALSIGTDAAVMTGIAAGLMFFNILFFAALAYAVRN